MHLWCTTSVESTLFYCALWWCICCELWIFSAFKKKKKKKKKNKKKKKKKSLKSEVFVDVNNLVVGKSYQRWKRKVHGIWMVIANSWRRWDCRLITHPTFVMDHISCQVDVCYISQNNFWEKYKKGHKQFLK